MMANILQFKTYTGVRIDPKNVRPENINIEDIAHALSNTCRFSGHVPRFYSVAQHSVHVANAVESVLSTYSYAKCNELECSSEYEKLKIVLAALLHDASEAYICDIPKPFKVLLPDYIELEKRITVVINKRFEIESYADHFAIKMADIGQLNAETEQFKFNIATGQAIVPLEPHKAAWLFIDKYNEIVNKIAEINAANDAFIKRHQEEYSARLESAFARSSRLRPLSVDLPNSLTEEVLRKNADNLANKPKFEDVPEHIFYSNPDAVWPTPVDESRWETTTGEAKLSALSKAITKDENNE